MEQIVLLVLACCTTVHFVLACVMSIYSRHKIQYLCLAWVNGLFFAMFLLAAFFSARIANGQPGVLHPMMLVSLVVACFLQSIYPLSIPMPAYLQWGRMWKYAAPAIVLIVIALARPRTYEETTQVDAEGIDIVLAMDVSTSMLARDLYPDRINAAKDIAEDYGTFQYWYYNEFICAYNRG